MLLNNLLRLLFLATVFLSLFTRNSTAVIIFGDKVNNVLINVWLTLQTSLV